MNLNELTGLIRIWAVERKLDIADPSKQMLKLAEEHGELAAALAKGRKKAKVKDAVGDMYVVLTILCMQLDIDIEDCIEAAYGDIADRKGKMVNGVFVKEEDLQKTSQVTEATREVIKDELYQDGIADPKTGRKKYHR